MSVWTAVIATTMVLVLGIAVDLSGLVHAKQQAGDAAAQAARQAGQQLSTGTLLQQGRLEVRTRQARAAAVDYLEAVGMTGTATVEDGTTAGRHRPGQLPAAVPVRDGHRPGRGHRHQLGAGTARRERNGKMR